MNQPSSINTEKCILQNASYCGYSSEWKQSTQIADANVVANAPIEFPNDLCQPIHNELNLLQFTQFTPGLLVYPSGLIVQVKDTQEVQYAVSNMGFQAGVVTWEILCPINCQGIYVGIVKHGFQMSKITTAVKKLIQFNTSTPRTIRLELDLDNHKLNYYLEGMLKEKKGFQNIDAGIWYPIVEIRNPGNMVALNPFTHENKFEMEQQVLREQQQIPEMKVGTNNPTQQSLDMLMYMMERNVIFVHKNKVKLISRQRDQSIPEVYLNTLFINKPTSINDLVYVWFRTETLNNILKVVNWKQTILPDYMLQEFSRALIQAYQCQDHTFVSSRFGVIKLIVNFLITFFQQQQQNEELFEQLQCLRTADEQLYAMSQKSDLDAELQSFLSITAFQITSRSFSSYGRMASFIDQVSTIEPLILAHNGIYKTPGLQNDYQFYLESNKKLEQFTAANEANLDEYIVKHLPKKRSVANFFNIPIEVTINSIPHLTLEENQYSFINSNQVTSPYISLLNQNGKATILNAELALFQVGTIDLRQISDPIKMAILQQSAFENDDVEALIEQKDKLSENSIISQPAQVISQDKPFEPDADLLNQLYAMGFTLEMSKQALISCKNAGIDQALEVVLQLQEKNMEEKEEETEITQELKMNWKCEQCTYLNTNQNHTCAVCLTQPPKGAYVEVEQSFISSPEFQFQEAQVILLQQEEVEAVDWKIEFLLDSTKSQLIDVVQLNSNAVSPVCLVGAFNPLVSIDDRYTSMIFVKQLTYSIQYFGQFIKPIGDGFVNILTNEQMDASWEQCKKAFLNNKQCRYISQTLEPLFGRNGKVGYQLEVMNECLVPLQQGQTIINMAALNKDNLFVQILENNLKYGLLYQICEEEQKLHLKLLSKFSLFDQPLISYVQVDNILYACTSKQLYTIDLIEYQTSIVESNVPEPITKLSYSNNLLHIHSHNQISTLLLKKQQHKLQPISSQDMIDISNLSASDIGSLVQLTQNEPVYARANSFAQSIHRLHTPYFQRHLFKARTQDIVYHLEKPSQLVNLKLEFTFQSSEPIHHAPLKNSSLTSDGNYVPLHVFSFRGCPFNFQTHVSKILFPGLMAQQEDNFTTNYANSEFIFEHLHGRRILVESFTVTSSLRSTQKGHPLGGGLIFLADHSSDFDTTKWECMNYEQYTNFRKNKLESHEPYRHDEPVGYFEMPETLESSVFTLDVSRPARFIMMKPTRFRTSGMQKSFTSSSVEFKFFGVQGHIIEGKQSELTVECLQSQFLERVVKSFEVCVYSEDGSRILVDLNESTLVSEENQGQSTLCSLSLQHKDLRNADIVRVEVSQRSPVPLLQWFIVSGERALDVKDSLASKISGARRLRNLMLNIDDYQNFNRHLVLELHNPLSNKRISCLEVLSQLMTKDKQLLDAVSKDMDWLVFLNLNVLKLDSPNEQAISTFMSCFQQNLVYGESVQQAVLQVMNSLLGTTNEASPIGLQFVLNLAFWSARINSSQMVPVLLDYLRTITQLIDQVKQQNPLYTNLSERDTHAEFDQGLFSEYYVKLSKPQEIKEVDLFETEVKEQVHQELRNKQQDPSKVQQLDSRKSIPSRIVCTATVLKHVQRFQIDLLGVFELNSMCLVMTTHARVFKMRVQVFRVGEHSSDLILDSFFDESSVLQLTQLAETYATDKRFTRLNELEVELPLICARYLVVQVTFSQSAYVQTAFDVPCIPSKVPAFIPEFRGTQTNEVGYIELFDLHCGKQVRVEKQVKVEQMEKVEEQVKHDEQVQLVNKEKLENLVKQENIKFGQSLSYSVQMVEGEQKCLLDSSTAEVVGGSTTLNADDIHVSTNSHIRIYQSYLQSFQRRLKDKLLADQGTCSVTQLCSAIRRIQLELLKFHAVEPVHFKQSLDFLLTMAYQLVDIILKVDELHKNWRVNSSWQNTEGLKLSELLFKVLVMNEYGPIRQHTSQLLQEVILDNLELKKWVAFTFQLYDKLGNQWDEVIKDKLNYFSVPLNESLQYLGVQLQVVPLQNEKVLNQEGLKQLMGIITTVYRNNPQIEVDPSIEIRVQDYKRGTQRTIKQLYKQVPLLPPGINRSQSSSDELSNLKLANYVLSEPLDQVGTLKLVYNIVIHVFKNNDSLQQEAIQLMFAILDTMTCSSVREFLDLSCNNEINLLDLIIIILSHKNTTNLKILLEKLFTPRLGMKLSDPILQSLEGDKKAIIANERDSLVQSQRIMLYIMYSLFSLQVQWVVDLEPQIYHCTSESLWIDHLTFSLDFLISWTDSIQKEIKEVVVARKKGGQGIQQGEALQQSEVLSYHDFQERLVQEKQFSICSTQTASILVSLLKKNTKVRFTQNSFYNRVQYWALLIKVIQRMRATQLIEQRIFEQIFLIYLNDLDDLDQEALFTDFINLTRSLSEQSSSIELNSFILMQVLEIKKIPLMRGILVGLLPDQERKVRLNEKVTFILLERTAQFLSNNCNVIGAEGIVGCTETMYIKFQIASFLLRILSEAETQTSQLSLSNLLYKTDPKHIENSLRLLIKWYTYNKTKSPPLPSSPGILLMKTITISIESIFTLIASFPGMASFCAHLMMEIQQEIDQQLVRSDEFYCMQRYALVKDSQEIFIQLAEQWLLSSQQVRDFYIPHNGFQYFLSRVNAREFNDTLKDSLEKQVATNVSLVNLPGQSIAFTNIDWQANRKGVKTRLFSFNMAGVFSEEYPLAIKLNGVYEIKHIRLAFQTFTQDFMDRVYGNPSLVLVEGGLELRSCQPLGSMELVNDESYSSYCTKVFQLNMVRGLKHGVQVSVLKFRVRRPVVLMLEGISQMHGRDFNNVWVGVNFLSIMGHDVPKINSNEVDNILKGIQENAAYTFLGSLSTSHPEVLQELAESGSAIQQFRECFPQISKAIVKNEQNIAPLLLGLALNNAELGDWVLEQFTDLSRCHIHAKIAAQIILQDRLNQKIRISNLLKFIIANIDQNETKQLIQLTSLMDAFLVALHITALNLQNNQLQPVHLRIERADLYSLIQLLRKHHELVHSKLIIKMVVNILNLPFPYTIEDNETRENATEYVLTLIDPIAEPFMFNVIAPLIFSSEYAQNWVNDRLESWFQSVLDLLTDVQKTDKTIIEYFLALEASVSIPKLRAYVVSLDYHTRIYESLKFSEPTKNALLKPIHPEALPLIVQFIAKCAIDSKEQDGGMQAQKLAQLLIADLKTLSQLGDMVFVESILMPLLNYQQMTDFVVQVWDSETRTYVCDLKSLNRGIGLSEDNSQDDINSFSPLHDSLLNREEIDILSKSAKELIRKSSTQKKGTWTKALEWDTDGDNKMFEQFIQATKSSPFLLLIQGKNGFNYKQTIVGVYCAQPISGKIKEEYETKWEIASNEDNFYFSYDSDNQIHYQINPIEASSPFGGLYADGSNGALLSFFKNGNQIISISFEEEQSSYIDIDCKDIKQIGNEQLVQQKYHQIQDFQFTKAELWVLQAPKQSISQQPLGLLNTVQTVGLQQNTNFGYGQLSTNLLHQYTNNNSVLAFYSSIPLYSMPSTVYTSEIALQLQTSSASVKGVSKDLIDPQDQLQNLQNNAFNNLKQSHGIVVLQLDGQALIKALVQQSVTHNLKFGQKMLIFDAFHNLDGVKQIIESLKGSILTWKNEERIRIWSQYVEELHAFCLVPAFFGFYLKNKSSMELLFQLLAGLPDQSEDKKWENQEAEAVKFIYDTLAEVFKSSNDESLRMIAIEKQLISKILDRIGTVSKEVKRQFFKHIQKEEEAPLIVRKDSEEEAKRKPDEKKKGVGYGSEQTGQNQKWNTQVYLDKKLIRSQQLQSLLEIITNFFDFKWNIGHSLCEKLKSMILESALLPLLESAFRSASLLEMSKEAELNQTYLKLARVLSSHKSLTPLLLQIPENYVPRQSQSIFFLLSQLNEVASIFSMTLTTEGADSVGKQISQSILQTYEQTQAAVDAYESQHNEDENEPEDSLEVQLKEILRMPLAQSYQLLMKDLRFDCIQMREKENGSYDHHYASHISGSGTPFATKMVRLAQEFADMSNSLPIEHTNSIFVRVDRERVDVMKALVMGAKGTPYAHGAYLFDIFFDENYPQGPPKMNLTTTGAGRIRFNPNLYACGKVCLSLLGTWRGHASENWDPKISTLLQILVSTQAIIMSEDVYFNEPGFEGEAGTEEGERKNEAYSNIVRYSNVKFAMIDILKNPPKGFEQVIKRHFYLKQHEILEEIEKWIKYSQQREASYIGLVHDHNSTWCTEFKKSKTRYTEMLREAYNELKVLLSSLSAPTTHELKSVKGIIRRPNRKSPTKQQFVEFDEIDVTYDKQQEVKLMDVGDEQVRDRWSRYIGAMGIEAVEKQSNAQVFISGMGALGVEIAKNIVLSGVKRLTLHDSRLASMRDLNGQFFLGEPDIGINRAEASLQKLQQLNYYVRVDLLNCQQALPEIDIPSTFSKLLEYDIVVLTELESEQVVVEWSKFCRDNKIKLIVSNVCGVYARVINDFGESFTVLDKNGEEPMEVVIKNISSEEKAIVEVLEGQRHMLEDGDSIIINNVVGMLDSEGKSINESVHKVIVINKSKFYIGDTTSYSNYQNNGTMKLIKIPIQLSFKPIHQCIEQPIYDQQLLMSDFVKIDNPTMTFNAFKTLQTKDLQQTLTLESIEDYTNRALKNSTQTEENENTLRQFFMNFIISVRAGQFPPLAAYIGGVVSQEIIKSLTNKFMPINQMYLTDCVEVLQTLPEDKSVFLQSYESTLRQPGMAALLGNELASKLEEVNLFMVGCGAIGCELLKNFAMLNIGVRGSLIITDPDHIETSNLSRQFLFREKHIQKSKSQTAAAAVIQMNPALKGHVRASVERLSELTESIFNDQFFEGLSVVANALDNVQARRYVDSRCVTCKIPLMESGTLGPKGHVQCIIPYQTESYGSLNDPVEEGEIPYCTLKMFPEETFHCVEFARDKFGKLFTLRPKATLKILGDVNWNPSNSEELKQLRQAVKLLEHPPQNYDQCVEWARRKYQKYFVNDVKQLVYTYPLDHKNKDGRPFWSLPKRAPQALEFSSSNELHVLFVSTLAYLRAKLFQIPIPNQWRQMDVRMQGAVLASKVNVKEWSPSEEKKKSISSEVSKMEQQQQQEEETVDLNDNSLLEVFIDLIKFFIKKKLRAIQAQSKAIQLGVEEFEKDNDQNGHIDFIHALGNLRAANYNLEPMDWTGVKIKAGRIVPALATTTAAISGLQSIELCKIIKKCKLEEMKNAFINLAVPYVQLTEPGNVTKTKLNEDITVTLWDRWDVWAEEKSLQDILLELEEKYKMKPINVFVKSTPIYMHEIHCKAGNEAEGQQILQSKAYDLFGLDEGNKYQDINVNFAALNSEGELLKNIPTVRVYLGQKL